ncbi:Phosphonoacetaldehyde hydrolase [Aquisphaera giovannonii]|uniref:phosphonoacetaldehyde hydrolase n=1 Tax=Aquisphaera giovannonii TaxID=406548 RepID=A0A5B9W0T2_9BACT|nr:phosphonoacetaldehyde hydrolase [Aquisphaera giovannonii]QEH33520.1 Phosphonoacetaldehyde hydrolase [Aquisphaera giovannonii]
MSDATNRLTAVFLDWAGTTVDHGSRAPALVFQEVFRRRGVPITAAQAREPMGMAKREHIATIARMPEVADRWREVHGGPCIDGDVDAIYEEFLPLQLEVLRDHSEVISGVPEAVSACRGMGLKIGSSTGYTRELMKVVSAAAKEQGYEPDCVFGADDARRGRPAPYLLFRAAEALDVFPLWKTVAVDDTTIGIAAGRNAGCWTVGITRTGNGVGLSAEEIRRRPAAEVDELCRLAGESLRRAGADYVIESVADLPSIIERIQTRMARGESPPQ